MTTSWSSNLENTLIFMYVSEPPQPLAPHILKLSAHLGSPVVTIQRAPSFPGITKGDFPRSDPQVLVTTDRIWKHLDSCLLGNYPFPETCWSSHVLRLTYIKGGGHQTWRTWQARTLRGPDSAYHGFMGTSSLTLLSLQGGLENVAFLMDDGILPDGIPWPT